MGKSFPKHVIRFESFLFCQYTCNSMVIICIPKAAVQTRAGAPTRTPQVRTHTLLNSTNNSELQIKEQAMKGIRYQYGEIMNQLILNSNEVKPPKNGRKPKLLKIDKLSIVQEEQQKTVCGARPYIPEKMKSFVIVTCVSDKLNDDELLDSGAVV